MSQVVYYGNNQEISSKLEQLSRELGLNYRQVAETPVLAPGSMPTGATVLPFPTRDPQSGSPLPAPQPHPQLGGVAKIEEMEAHAIENAITTFRGNLTEAARALGIGRATLYRKVKQYNIDPTAARSRKNKIAA